MSDRSVEGRHDLPSGFEKDVVGYCDPLSVRPGATVGFKLSSGASRPPRQNRAGDDRQRHRPGGRGVGLRHRRGTGQPVPGPRLPLTDPSQSEPRFDRRPSPNKHWNRTVRFPRVTQRDRRYSV